MFCKICQNAPDPSPFALTANLNVFSGPSAQVTLSDSQKDDMTMEDSADQSEYLWVRFDLIFGSFVFINGLTLGYQIDSAGNEKSPCISIYTLFEEISLSRGVSDAAFWYLVENFFLVIFTSEWFLRWAIFAQSKFEMDVPLMLGFLPAMPEDGTPGYKRKAWQMLLVAESGRRPSAAAS